jgi:hypothetical protein
MPLCKYLVQAVWTWSSTCPNLFIVPSASVCHAVRLGKHSGLHSVWFKKAGSFWALLKGIKQQAIMEFLVRENEAAIKIHQWFLAFCGADTVDLSAVCHVRKSGDCGRNVDQPQAVQLKIWTGEKKMNLFKKINLFFREPKLKS